MIIVSPVVKYAMASYYGRICPVLDLGEKKKENKKLFIPSQYFDKKQSEDAFYNNINLACHLITTTSATRTGLTKPTNNPLELTQPTKGNVLSPVLSTLNQTRSNLPCQSSPFSTPRPRALLRDTGFHHVWKLGQQECIRNFLEQCELQVFWEEPLPRFGCGRSERAAIEQLSYTPEQ